VPSVCHYSSARRQHPSQAAPQSSAEMAAMNITFKQFAKDLAFTFAAALGTGALVGGLSFLVVRFFAA